MKQKPYAEQIRFFRAAQKRLQPKREPCETCQGDGCMDCNYEGWTPAEIADDRAGHEADYWFETEGDR